jgi:hypothetical protein
MENEMINRCLAGIREDRIVWNDGCGNTLVDVEGIVRDVIEALRVPTEAMREAYTEAADDNDGPAACYIQMPAYAAMIDAALKPAGAPGSAPEAGEDVWPAGLSRAVFVAAVAAIVEWEDGSGSAAELALKLFAIFHPPKLSEAGGLGDRRVQYEYADNNGAGAEGRPLGVVQNNTVLHTRLFPDQ